MQAGDPVLPLHRHATAAPGGESYYMQSPLMTFMAPDVDLGSLPFTLALGSGVDTTVCPAGCQDACSA